jgi:pimeloyl-ACP methyl ester carboxylesterase
VENLVLLHAFPFDSRMFDSVRTDLSAAATMLTPDLRGFGSGPPLGDATPDLALLADDVVDAMDAAGMDRAVLGGVSMGGYVALALLRRHPERVKGLVLVDTRSGPDDAAAVERRQGVAARADGGDVASGPDAIAPLVAAGSADDIRATLATIADSIPAATIAWAQRAMAGRPDSTAVLAAASVPVLIVVGEDDAVTPPAAAHEMAAAARDAELVELPGAGHLTPAEDPEGFAVVVLDWLSRRF